MNLKSTKGAGMPFMMKNRHGTYYLRLVLSGDQKERYGRGEYRRSLGTSSIREARRRLPGAYMEAIHLLDTTSPSMATTSPDVATITVQANKKSLQLSKFFKGPYTSHLQTLGVRDKTVIDKKCILDLFIAVCGDRELATYTKADARLFRDTALELPPRKTFKLLSEGYSLDHIKEIEGTVTVGTVNNWIRNLGAMFKVAVEEELCAFNPFESLSIKAKVKPSSLRDRFKEEDVRRILAYTASTSLPERFWLPRLGVYTGARLGELAQLFRDDIKDIDGVHCIHIHEGNETQRLKTLSSERMIPIHSKLIELGFLEYVERSDGHIFPNLKYHPLNGYRDGYSKHFSWMLGKLSIKSPERKVSFHSFRHFVADTLKQQGVAETMIGSLLGHTVGGITNNRYGKDYQVEVLKEVVQAIPCL